MAARGFRLPWRRAVVRTTEQRLTQRRIYLLPTRNGLLLGLVLVAMLVGAMNYGNSLAYALTFLLTSVAVVSILHTYANMAGLTVRAGQCRPIFAGEPAVFPIAVDNPGRARYALSFELESGRAITDAPANGVHWLELRQPTAQRGWNELARVTVASSFPLGLFRAWSYLDLQQHCLVYPRPEVAGPPPPAGSGGGERAHPGRGNEDFAGLRDYRAGDSLRHVHWKALAREQGLLTKEFEGGGGRELWFDWDALGGLAPEARLARMCRWVLLADGEGHAYGLTLPGQHLERGRGPGQRQRCLEALALYGIKK
jgi:uncharacterized protein (DUF58 family)